MRVTFDRGVGSRAKRRPNLQMLMQTAKLIFSGEQPRIPC